MSLSDFVGVGRRSWWPAFLLVLCYRVFMIAALFVSPSGPYAGLPGVDVWSVRRDARLYDGSFPVVCHPPCQRWGKFWAGSPLVIARTGQRFVKGDDGGCFASALAAVRRCGGVLEHPWGSAAWPFFGLAVPPRSGGWVVADSFGGMTCCVEQGRYGHVVRKPTLLYAVGCGLPWLDFGISDVSFPSSAIDRYGLARCKRMGEMALVGGGRDSPVRIATPLLFRDVLLAMARSSVV